MATATDYARQQHYDLTTARLTERSLSLLELRREHRQRANELDTADPGTKELLEIESQVLLDLIQQNTPPPPTPTELLAQLKETDPDRAEALGYSMRASELESALDSARLSGNDSLIEQAELALHDHMAQGISAIDRPLEISRLRERLMDLPGLQESALHDGEFDRAAELAGELTTAQARLTELTGEGEGSSNVSD